METWYILGRQSTAQLQGGDKPRRLEATVLLSHFHSSHVVRKGGIYLAKPTCTSTNTATLPDVTIVPRDHRHHIWDHRPRCPKDCATCDHRRFRCIRIYRWHLSSNRSGSGTSHSAPLGMAACGRIGRDYPGNRRDCLAH